MKSFILVELHVETLATIFNRQFRLLCNFVWYDDLMVGIFFLSISVDMN